MKFKKLDLLTLLISLFALGACENPSGIGLEVDPDIALSSDTSFSNVVTQLLKEDSIITSGTERSVLAYFKDPVFGITTSNMALAATLPNSSLKFGTAPVLDSAVLVLPFSGFYGDSLNSTFTAEVRQLNELLYFTTPKAYYNTKIWSKKDPIIGSGSFTANYKDSITLPDIRAGLADTVRKVPAQIRIKLDPNFITNNIINADSANLASSEAFANYFKGLYVSLKQSSITNNGGFFLFDTRTQGGARIDLFYKNTNAAGTRDTVTVAFPINGVSGNAVSEITWNINNTPVKTALENNINNPTLYLKGLAGTKVKVSFPNINSLKSLGTNVVINRAELIISVVNGTQTPYKPLPALRIYRWDIANQPQPIPDENQGDPRFLGPGFIGGFYSAKNNNYIINLTGYIQDLMSGKTTDYGTFITTYDLLTNSNKLSFPGRSVVGGGSNTEGYKMRLKVYYTDQK